MAGLMLHVSWPGYRIEIRCLGPRPFAPLRQQLWLASQIPSLVFHCLEWVHPLTLELLLGQR